MIETMLVGTAAGVLAGLLGVGGGILFVPALVLLFHDGQLLAQGTSLLAMVPVAVVGAWRQHRYGNAGVRPGIVIGSLSALGLAVGLRAANALPERALELAFAGLLVATAVQLGRRAWAAPRRAQRAPGPRQQRPADAFRSRAVPPAGIFGDPSAPPTRANRILWRLLGW
jgi:uncharacterized membrane protein YfcA